MMDITANMLKSACSVPGTVLSALHVLIYIIFATIL